MARAGAVLAVLSSVAAAPASASQLYPYLSGGATYVNYGARYDAEPGERNSVTFAPEVVSGVPVITDFGARMTAVPPCMAITPNVGTCLQPDNPLTVDETSGGVFLSLGDGNDRATLNGGARTEAGDGADYVLGSAESDEIIGGPGNDVIVGGPSPDGLDAGDGDDRIDSRDGFDDSVSCGPGVDVAYVDAADLVLPGCESVVPALSGTGR